jgi:non-specific serine/threonine protein kinase
VLDQLERDQDNLRAALRFLIDSGKPTRALELAEALFQLGHIRGSLGEAQAWLRELLALPAVGRAPAVRGGILPLLGELASRHGDYTTALDAYQQALAMYQSMGDRVSMANVLSALATLNFDQGEYQVATAYLNESLTLADDIKSVAKNNWWYVAGGIALHEGRLDEAGALFNEALAGEPGSQLGGYCQKDLGLVALERGDYAEARTRMARALDAAEELSDRNLLAYTLEAFASLAAALGQHARALCLAGSAAVEREARSSWLPIPLERMLQRWLDVSRKALNVTDADAAWTIGTGMELNEASAYARDPLAAMPEPEHAPQPGGSKQITSKSPLTRREREVAALVALGWSDGRIAERLVVSQRTVAAHVEHMLNKLGFASRTQIGVWAAEHHIGSTTHV